MNTKKVLLNALPLLLIGTAMVYAAAPSGGYLPGATNDPACAPGDADCFVLLPSETPNKFVDGTDLADAVYTGTGNVGIGTTSPSNELHVVGVSRVEGRQLIKTDDVANGTLPAPFYITNNSSTVGLSAGVDVDNAWIQTQGNVPLILNKAGGNIGIGTTSPSANLEIVEEVSAAQIKLRSFNDTIMGNGAHFIGHRARGTVAAPTEPLSGDMLATFQGRSAISEVSYPGLRIVAEEDFTATEQGASVRIHTTPIGGVGSENRVTVAPNGNVGIGTEVPLSQLDIQTEKNGVPGISSNLISKFSYNGNGTLPNGRTLQMGAIDSGAIYLQAAQYNNFSIRTNLALNPDGGNVGIGTTSPAATLDIKGHIQFNRGENNVVNGSDIFMSSQGLIASESNLFINSDANGTGAGDVIFKSGTETTAATTNVIIKSTGNVGIGTGSPSYKLHVNGSVAGVGAYVNTSDKRLKRDLVSIDNGLEKILELEGYTFDWRRDEYADMDFPEGRDMGVIAQDVEKVFPEAVSQDDEGMLSVGYSKLIAPIIEAIRELSEMIFEAQEINTAQDAEIESLKSQNTELLKRLEALEKK